MGKRIQSFRYAWRGIRFLFLGGTNARIQLGAAVLALLAGIALEFRPGEWMAVVLCIGMVLSAEAMNTALELLADEVSEERRERIGKAKDLAAGAVLIAALASVGVGIVILLERI